MKPAKGVRQSTSLLPEAVLTTAPNADAKRGGHLKHQRRANENEKSFDVLKDLRYAKEEMLLEWRESERKRN